MIPVTTASDTAAGGAYSTTSATVGATEITPSPWTLPWRHAITLDATLAPDPSHLYPRLTEVAGACSPKDVGGTPGYERFLAILANADHSEHADLLTWAGGPFDPHVPPADELRLDVLKLAKWWKPRNR